MSDPDTIPCCADGCEDGRVEVAYCPHPLADQPAYRFVDCDECAGTGEVEPEWNVHQAPYVAELERTVARLEKTVETQREQLVAAWAAAEMWKRRAQESERGSVRQMEVRS